jgi:3'(2'),5'-bisphosphate nucleotidase
VDDLSLALARELNTAVELGRRAGALIGSLQGAGLAVERKSGDEPVTEADRRASALILDGLAAAFPGDALLSEEAPDSGARHHHSRVWMIDPIDGTNDFIRGDDGFAVMIGLLVDEEPALGVVYQPRGDRLYRAVRGGGAFLEEGTSMRRVTVSTIDSIEAMRMVASKSHRDESITRVKQSLGISDEVNVGSVGLKLGLIARGDRELYVNLQAKSKRWDALAPQVILHEAGGRLTDARGRPLDYRAQDLTNRDGLVASNGRLHERIVARIAPILDTLGTRGT